MPDSTHEYRTVQTRAAWTRGRDHGWLRFTGAEVLSFLQALVTNDVAPLPVGGGVYTAYLTPHGRMISDLAIFRRPDDVIAAVPRALAPALATRFDQLVFAEDVQVADVSGDYTEFWIVGGDSVGLLARALGVDASAIDGLPALAHVAVDGGFIARTTDARLPNFRVLAPAAVADTVGARLSSAGVAPLSDDLGEWLRIEAGRPKFGVDMTADTIPLEAGLLDRAISTSKGCYVGQEIIVRILHRAGGRVARRLVALRIDGAEMVGAGTPIDENGQAIGILTSIARSPVDESCLGLGYVHRDAAESGKVLGITGRRAAIVGFAG